MITRDNYEEFFMLYVDNELSASDRQAVERFVAGHPDLKEEWEFLLQCRLLPDQQLVFPGRDLLRKTETAEDLHADYFLSYIDGELEGRDLVAMEEIIRHHPNGLNELEQWRKTIAYPDTSIIFPDKKSLYRKEEDKKIFWLPWIRIGAAAAIAGVVVLLLLPGVRPERRGSGASAGTGSVRHLDQVTASRQPVVKPAASPASPSPSPSPSPIQAVIKNKKNAPAVTSLAAATLYSTGAKTDPVTKEVALLQPESTRLPAAARLRLPEPSAEMPGGLPPPDQTLAANRNIEVNAVMVTGTDIPKDQSSFATEALQDKANGQENNGFVMDERSDKSKLRGVFRKVVRTFGKTADRDKDGQRQVLIGAFQFALN
jgi:hypothetical protein